MRVSFTLIIILIFGCTKSDSDLDENLSKEGTKKDSLEFSLMMLVLLYQR